ncbi:MAG: pyruvate ferredoxin oxidoreductase subunit gamma [Candidatus Diapherotrites archaeon]|nr:pyruvate ferredoxin oxidoreductase subunit gamma [Candidatus Diapherotrites archaeon]
MDLREIRIHGRGGQGAVTSSQVMAIAAFFDGKYSQAFPYFGVERTGAPVEAYVRVSKKPINLRQHVYTPDYVLVLEPSLLKAVDTTNGLKKTGLIVVNSNKKPYDLGLKGGFKVYAIDITKVALDIIGKPFVNIAGLGALAGVTGEISLQALEKAIDQRFGAKGKISDLNKQACAALFEEGKKLGK